jgi:uncharacterized protein YbcV (DUF1398 family)
MNTDNPDRDAVRQLNEKSSGGALTFPQVVSGLAGAGVGSYFADYRAGATRYYFRSGATENIELKAAHGPIGPAFDSSTVQAAIKRAQRDEIRYPEFVRLTMAAGCVGYFVWIDGRHVAYLGPRGEVHVERFPGAK